MGDYDGLGNVATAAIEPKRFVKLSATQNKVTQCGANEIAMGVSQQAARDPQFGASPASGAATAANQQLEIIPPGKTAVVTAGGAITRPGQVKSDANGKAVALATTGTTKQNSGGYALTDAAADGDDILVLVWPDASFPALA